MHPTLTPAGNVLLASLWAVAAAVLVFLYPELMPIAVAGLVLGAVAGVLQGRAVDAHPETFAAAANARQIRETLLSTRSGKAAIVIQWCSVAILLAMSLMLSRQRYLAGVISGYAAFMFLRELVALPSVRRLARHT